VGAQWVLKTLGGVNINAGTAYTSKLARHAMRMQTGARSVSVAGRGDLSPTYAGSTLGERTIIVEHEIVGSGATHETNLNTIKALYDPTHGARTLVFTADGVDKRATVVATRMLPHSSNIGLAVVTGEWVLLDHRYYADSAGSVSAVAKTSSPATLSVANAGTTKSPRMIVTLKPTAAKSAANGQRYGYYITPINRSPRPIVNWPVDLADNDRGSGAGGWDHAAEVTATRSQADGDDVEVYVNAVRTNRWFGPTGQGAANTTTTAVWINLDMPPVRTWTYVGAGVLADNALTMTVKENLIGMPSTPFYAALDNGSATEFIRVTAYSQATRTLTIVRGQRGIAATTWAAGSTLYWTPVLIDLVYGGTSLPTPGYIDDDYKPMMLDNTAARSSNDVFKYTEFQESRATATTQDRKPRGGSWRTRMAGPIDRDAKTGDGDMYVRYIPRTATLATDAAIASKMCLAYRSAGATAGHPIMDRWELDSPIGITGITHTMVTTTIDFDGGFESQGEIVAVDIDGNEEVLATHDATTTTAEALTPSANAYVVWFRIDPFDPKVDYTTVDVAAQEPTAADGMTVDDVLVTFSTTEELVIAWGSARRDVYQFGRPDAPATLANSDGDTLSIYGLVVSLNDTVDLDVEAHTATLDDGTGRAHVVRGTWPWLPKGTNNLTFTEAGIGTVEVGVSSFRSAWI